MREEEGEGRSSTFEVVQHFLLHHVFFCAHNKAFQIEELLGLK